MKYTHAVLLLALFPSVFAQIPDDDGAAIDQYSEDPDSTETGPTAFVHGDLVVGGSSGEPGEPPSGESSDLHVNGNVVILGTGSAQLFQGSQATGSRSFAGGTSAIASDDESFAFGRNVQATNRRAIAMGQQSYAHGYKSFALQGATVTSASAGYGIAMGLIAETSSSHGIAMGWANKSTEFGSFATGHATTAGGQYSATFGEQTQATAFNHFVLGSFNVGLKRDGSLPSSTVASPDDPIFEVGNGDGSDSDGNTVPSASNALVIYRDGTIQMGKAQGDISMGVFGVQ